MRVSPEDLARITDAMEAVMVAARVAKTAPDTFVMRQRLSTLRAAANRADALILDVETTTRERALKELEPAS